MEFHNQLKLIKYLFQLASQLFKKNQRAYPKKSELMFRIYFSRFPFRLLIQQKAISLVQFLCLCYQKGVAKFQFRSRSQNLKTLRFNTPNQKTCQHKSLPGQHQHKAQASIASGNTHLDRVHVPVFTDDTNAQSYTADQTLVATTD